MTLNCIATRRRYRQETLHIRHSNFFYGICSYQPCLAFPKSSRVLTIAMFKLACTTTWAIAKSTRKNLPATFLCYLLIFLFDLPLLLASTFCLLMGDAQVHTNLNHDDIHMGFSSGATLPCFIHHSSSLFGQGKPQFFLWWETIPCEEA